MARLKIAPQRGCRRPWRGYGSVSSAPVRRPGQKERALITARTKAALAAAKPRVTVTGQKKHPEVKRLGNPNGAAHLRQYGGKAGRAALIANADKRAASLAATIDALRAEGVTSANGIAKALNERSIATPRGGKWAARSVLNLTARLA